MVPWRHGGHCAEGYCNYGLSFGSGVLLSLFLCFSVIEITGRRDGMGWDGEGIKFRYLGAVCRLPKVRLDLFGVAWRNDAIVELPPSPSPPMASISGLCKCMQECNVKVLRLIEVIPT